MRYLGGKYRIRKQVAAVVAEYGQGRPVWEPFCGGLNSAGAHGGTVFCSDIDQSLISLYQAVSAGWDPPTTVTEEEYQAAKLLPETDPMHGFCAFGCSFGGKRWGGFARGAGRNWAAECSRGLTRDCHRITAFFRCDFLSLMPAPHGCVLYCDPPYQGTTGYAHGFDHDLFVQRVQEWARYGPVLVSEYAFPVGRVVWEHAHSLSLQSANRKRTERIYVLGL